MGSDEMLRKFHQKAGEIHESLTVFGKQLATFSILQLAFKHLKGSEKTNNAPELRI
jgi:hypothetical protein